MDTTQSVTSSAATVKRNSTEEKALALLGSGLGPEVVATACGVSASRISQLLSEPEFAAAVSELRFTALQKHNERDNTYDALEEKLQKQLGATIPMLMRPMEIARVLSVVNAAKRRGSSAPESVHNQNTVVSIMLPTKIIQNFTTNINNQVVQIGTQELQTIQAGSLKNLVADNTAKKLQSIPLEQSSKEINYVQTTPEGDGAGISSSPSEAINC